MIINFDKIEEKSIEGFKGGKGTLLTRMADDGNVKIMRNVLKPGSSIGTHTHTDNCEVIYVLEGQLTFICEDGIHYCPKGKMHTGENRTEEDATFIAFVG